MAAKGKFKYGNRTVPMSMSFTLADTKMEDLGLNILGVLSDGGQTIQTLLLDDRLLLKVWYYYVKEETADSWEDALAVLDETEGGLEEFREAFFTLIVNFSSPPTRKILREMWDQAKTQMKDSRRIKSMVSSYESSEEPDLTSDTIPSEKS